MKCIRIKESKKVIRVKDGIARQMVWAGKATFTSKSAWKASGKNYKE